MENNTVTNVNKVGQIEAEQGIHITNVVIRPVQRESQNIKKWRDAMQAAEGYIGNRQYLYDLYDDILLDLHLSAVIGKRINGVTKNKLRFVDAEGIDVEAIKPLLKKKQFRRLRNKIQWAKMWGIGVIELDEDQVKGLKIYSVPYKHIRPREGMIISEQSDVSNGIYYRQPPYSKYVIEVCEDRENLGLLLKCAPYVIYKRGGFGDLAQCVELFGMPFRKGTYDGYDETTRIQLELALERAGSAAFAVIPKGGDIEFIENKSTGGGELYNLLIDSCNKELSIGVLGNTDTTSSSQGSGYAIAKVHADGQNDINQDDCEDEISILNEDVIPILATLGYPVQGGSFIYADVDKQTLKDRIVIDTAVADRQPVSDDYFYQKYGIPKPENYDQLKAEMAAAAQANADAESDAEAKAPIPKIPNPTKPVVKKLSADQQIMYDLMCEKLADFFDPAP